jgi:hypothetical protein
MPKAMQDEIDTILETEEGVAAKSPAQQLEALSAEISLGSELESSKMEISQAAALPEKAFFFNDFPPKVYCTLTGIGSFKSARGAASPISPSRRSATADEATWPRGPIGLQRRALRHSERLHPQHPSRLLEPSLREAPGRA